MDPIIRKQPWNPAFSWREQDRPVDLTTDTLKLYLTPKGASTAVLTRITSTGSNVSWTSQTEGTGAWQVNGSATDALTAGWYDWSTWLTTAAAPTPRRVAHGEIEVITDPADGGA